MGGPETINKDYLDLSEKREIPARGAKDAFSSAPLCGLLHLLSLGAPSRDDRQRLQSFSDLGSGFSKP